MKAARRRSSGSVFAKKWIGESVMFMSVNKHASAAREGGLRPSGRAPAANGRGRDLDGGGLTSAEGRVSPLA